MQYDGRNPEPPYTTPDDIEQLRADNARLQAELDALREIVSVARMTPFANDAICMANGIRRVPIILPLPAQDMREAVRDE